MNRPACVPLFTVDPFFSVWSFCDEPTDDQPRHWTGSKYGMLGLLWIDGTPYRFLGNVATTDQR